MTYETGIIRDHIVDHQQGFYRAGKLNDGDISFVRITDLTNNGYVDFSTTPKVFVEKEDFERFELHKGDFLFARTGGAGKFGLIQSEIKAVFASYLIKFQFNEYLTPSFVRYYFLSDSFQQSLKSRIHGGVNQNIHAEDIKNVEIPIPPFPEQHRIVAKLDSLFERTDKAIALIEQNIANAKHLMASVINDWFDQSEMATCSYDDLQRDNLIGLVRNAHQQGLTLPYKYVKMNNITSSGSLDMYNYTCINASDNEVSRFSLQKGDFLFNTRNSYELVGKTCVFDSDEKQVTFNNNILRTRFKNNVNPYYIGFQFKSEYVKNQLTSLKSGTTNVSAIYYKGLAKLKLRVPEISEQNRAVRFLSKMNVQQEKYIVKLENQKTRLLELKSSLLDAAFKGEL